jgi:hypothetical protein
MSKTIVGNLVVGHLVNGLARIDSVVLALPADCETGQMQARDGLAIGGRYRFEAIDGRAAEIEIRAIVPPNALFAFVRPLQCQVDVGKEWRP